MGVPAGKVAEIPASPPAAEPTVPAATPAPVGAEPSDSTDWNDLLVDDADSADEGMVANLPEVVVTQGEEKPPVPVVPAAAAPAATPPATPVVEAPPAPVAETPPAPAAETPPAVEPQPQQTAEQRLALRENYIKELSATYTLSAEDEAQLVAAPNKVLPQLAARLRVDIVDQVIPMIVQNLMASLPGMIDSHSTRRATATESENTFFTKWPELKGHDAAIQRIAQQWRQMNPKATREEAIQEVGILAWRAAKLPIAGLMARMADPQQTPGQIVEEVVRQPVQQAPRGFAPAPSAPAASGGTPTGKSWQEELLALDDDS